jgi:hypothetical protein
MNNLNAVESDFLANIVNRYVPKGTHPRNIKFLQFGNLDLSIFSSSIKFEEGLAFVSCLVPHSHSIILKDIEKQWGKEVIIITDDGEEFSADVAYQINRRVVFGGIEAGNRLTIECRNWFFYKKMPRFWVGHIEKNIHNDPGNLTIEVKDTSVSNGHYYLKGAEYDYYIVLKKEEYLIVIDTNSAFPSFKQIDDDIRVLSFCFSYPIKMNFCTGFDETGNVTGALGNPFGFYKLTKNIHSSPIPNHYTQYFLPSLFNKISSKIGEDKFLLEAIWLYVESSTEIWYSSIEMKLLFSCVGVSHCFIEKKDKIIYVGSKNQIDISDRSLLNHSEAVAEISNNDLVENSNNGIHISGPIDLIWYAIDKAELKDLSELKSVVDESYQSILGLFNTLEKQINRDRVAALRFITLKLICSYVGYTGPIENGLIQESNYQEMQRWQESLDMSKSRFLASVDKIPIVEDPAQLWPSFVLPTIPENSLLVLVDNFADGLLERTENSIQARLVPVPKSDDQNSSLYDFTIELMKPPFANTILFTVEYSKVPDEVKIINWGEDKLSVKGEKELILQLNNIAKSQRVKEVIERLMLSIYEK